MSSADDYHRGGLSQAWIVRCAYCPAKHTIEDISGRIEAPDEQIITWIREDGYTYFKGIGWLCYECTQQVLEQRLRRKKGRAPQ